MNQDGCTGSFDAAICTKEVHTMLLIQTTQAKYAFTCVNSTLFLLLFQLAPASPLDHHLRVHKYMIDGN